MNEVFLCRPSLDDELEEIRLVTEQMPLAYRTSLGGVREETMPQSTSWEQERRGGLSVDSPGPMVSCFPLAIVCPLESRLCWTSAPSGGLLL